MPDFHEFDVSFRAPMRVLPPRARKEKDVLLACQTRVRVPVMGHADAPVASRMRERGSAKWHLHRKLGPDFYQPLLFAVAMGDQGVPAALDGVAPSKLADALRHPDTAVLALFDSRRAPWQEGDQAEFWDDLGAARVIADGRDLAINMVHEAAADFLILDGHVHGKTYEPHFHVKQYHSPERPRSVFRYLRTGDDASEIGARFRLGRESVMEEFFARSGAIGYRQVGEDRTYEYGELDAGALDLREDRYNARFALELALREAGPFLHELSPDAIMTLADARRLRLGVQSGEATPDAAPALLERLASEVPRTNGNRGIHMGIDLGLAAMELSLPSPDLAAMDADDAEAIQGLGL